MSLRAKMLMITSLVIFVMVVILYGVTSLIFIRNFNNLQNQKSKNNMSSLYEVLTNDYDNLISITKDWSSWDDTFNFIKDKNQQFIDTNLIDSSFTNLGLNFLLLLDNDGNVVFAKSFDLENNKEINMPSEFLGYFKPGSQLLDYSGKTNGNTGIIMLQDYPAIISSQPILKSDESGPKTGSLIWGYYINESVIQTISKTTGLDISLIKVNEMEKADKKTASIVNTIQQQILKITQKQQSLADGLKEVSIYLEPVNRNDIIGYLLVNDIYGNPAFLLKSDMSRDIYNQGLSTLIYLSVILLLSGFAIGIVLLFILDRLVLKRILKLSNETKDIISSLDNTKKLKVKGKDEISKLTVEVNMMLDSLRKQEAILTHMATHDSLTGIANRRIFENDLTKAISKAARGIKSFIIFIDIDNFKVINDTYGHAFGDKVLISISQQIKNNIRNEDAVARFGGDEFIVLVEHNNLEKAKTAAERLREIINQFNREFENDSFNFTVSMGMVPIEGFEPPSLLLSWADRAMYEAKANGKNQLVVFNKSGELKNDKIEMLDMVKDAIDNDKLYLHFQPIINLYSREIIYYEALVRIANDKDGLIMPHMFIPVAEKYGVIGKLTIEVLNKVIKLLKIDLEKCIFINLSSKCFLDNSLLANIEDIIKQSKINPGQLGFEIAESTIFNDSIMTTKWVNRIVGLGCKFAIDGFGTGFSSYNILNELPVEFFKIDGSIIKGISNDHSKSAMVKSVNLLATLMGKKTVAEWIENSETAQAVKELGIEYGQGFYLGEPKP